MSGFEHEDAWTQWRDAIGGTRMHHAWMLAGRKGLGKMQFALNAARELIAGSGVSTDPLAHPDILILHREPKDTKEEKKRDEGKPFDTKRNISVEQVRAMQRRLKMRPTLGSKRTVIINTADILEKSAANALLKTLEEPPKNTYFLLVSHSPARLLPTIRSRCRTVRFATLSNETIMQFLADEAPEIDLATRQAAADTANGSPGTALGFLARNSGASFELMTQIVKQGDQDRAARGKLAEMIGTRPARDDLLNLLELSRLAVANASISASTNHLTILAETHSDLVRLTGQIPIYNFDPTFLIAQIGNLLASAAPFTESVDA